MNIEKVVEEAYKLYMPQDKYEITEFAEFLQELWLKQALTSLNIVEIGTKFGGTFYIWNELAYNHWKRMNIPLYENKHGWNVISIDMSDGGIHGGISDEEMNKRDLWFTERFTDCHFIRGDSHDSNIKQQCFNILYLNTPFNQYKSEIELLDFLFIDGDHTYEGVKQDFNMYSPFVKKGGVIAFHDTVISERHHSRDVYVGEFWNELTELRLPKDKSKCAYGGQVYQIHEFVKGDLDWAGIGVLVKL